MNICINNKKLKIGLIAFILYRILVFGLNEKFDLYLMIFGVNQWIINLLVDVLIIIKDLKKQIMTDDDYTPFSCNDYELNWLDNNSVEIIYGFGNEYNTYKKELIRFD